MSTSSSSAAPSPFPASRKNQLSAIPQPIACAADIMCSYLLQEHMCHKIAQTQLQIDGFCGTSIDRSRYIPSTQCGLLCQPSYTPR